MTLSEFNSLSNAEQNMLLDALELYESNKLIDAYKKFCEAFGMPFNSRNVQFIKEKVEFLIEHFEIKRKTNTNDQNQD